MATTIQSSPQLYTFSGNNLIWVFSSNQTAQPNFSFIVEVVLNSVVIGTHEVFLEQNNYAKIDVQTIVDSAISYDDQTIDETIGGVIQTTPNLYLNVKEKYGSPATIQSTTATSTIYLLKGALPFENFVNYDYTDFKVGTTAKRFLTDSPLLTDFGTFGILIDDPSAILDTKLVVTINGVNRDITYSNGSRLIFFNINNTTLLAAGFTQPQIDADSRISFYVKNVDSGFNISETKTIYRVECSNFINKLTFINRYSIPEQFVFRQHERYIYNATATSYEKRQGTWVGNAFVLSPLNSGFKPIQTIRTGTLELFTEIIPTELAAYLLTEINSSPYIVLNDTSIFIAAQGFEIPNENDDVKQISVRGKLANSYKSNRI
jgi:hypothetical protein